MEKVSVVTSRRSRVGEGPHWDPRIERLVYVDLTQGVVCRLDPSTQKEEAFHLGDHFVSFAIPLASDPNRLIIAKDRQLQILNWDTKETEFVTEVEERKETRFNDGKCDSRGRLWAGTMSLEVAPGVYPEKMGSLYSLRSTSDLVTQHKSEVSISNGIAWSKDNKKMYFADSTPRKIFAFDFDDTKGTISNERTLVDFNSDPIFGDCGLPDGMTMDDEDKLWLACFGGGRVLRIDPETGGVIRTLFLPVKNITSCNFGGPNYDELYVTSAWHGLSEAERMNQEAAGAVFKVTGLGVRGLASNNFVG